MRQVLVAAIVGATTLVAARAAAQTFDGRAVSRNGNLVVSYSVKDGYKVSVTVDTRKKKGAFRESTTTDVSGMAVEFADLDGDGLEDVIVKYEDESSYQPMVLIQRAGPSFVKALTTSFVVWTESDPGEEDVPRPRWRLRKVKGRNVPDLVFPDVVLGRDRYRDATFRFDPATGRYALHRTGEKLGPLGGAVSGRPRRRSAHGRIASRTSQSPRPPVTPRSWGHPERVSPVGLRRQSPRGCAHGAHAHRLTRHPDHVPGANPVVDVLRHMNTSSDFG